MLSATSRSERGCRPGQPILRCTPASRSYCCHRKSRSCSWARSGAAGNPSCSSAILSQGLETRCARAGAGNLPISRNSEMMPPAKGSPTLSSTFEMSKLDWAEPTRQAHAAWLALPPAVGNQATRDCPPAARHGGICRSLSSAWRQERYRRVAARRWVAALPDRELCGRAGIGGRHPRYGTDALRLGRDRRHPTERDLRVAIPMT